MRLAPRDDLAGLARVAPLLRAARDLDEWVAGQRNVDAASELEPSMTEVAASALDLAPREVVAAWQVVLAARSATAEKAQPEVGTQPENGTEKPASGEDQARLGLGGLLIHGSSEAVLNVWDTALAVILASEELDGIATALYTVGDPVGIDGLFDAYASAAGPGRAAGAGPRRRQPAAELVRTPILADMFAITAPTFRWRWRRWLTSRSSSWAPRTPTAA